MIKKSTKRITNKKNRIKMRQFITAACIFSVTCCLYACDSISAEPEPEPVIINVKTNAQEEVIPVQAGTIQAENDLTTEVALQETTEIRNQERENTLYYVVDGDKEFYLNEEYQDYLWNLLKVYGHSEFYELCIALMYHESKFDQTKVSATDDYGLMQIHGGNLAWLKRDANIQSLTDPYDNIDGGVYILLGAYAKYGDVETALVCYNQGSVKLGANKTASTKYSRSVLKDLEKLRIIK